MAAVMFLSVFSLAKPSTNFLTGSERNVKTRFVILSSEARSNVHNTTSMLLRYASINLYAASNQYALFNFYVTINRLLVL